MNKPTPSSPSPALVFAGLVTIQVLFGLNYVISKVVVEAFPPLVWASIRIIIATIVMAVVAIAMKRKFPGWNREFFGPLVIFALLGTVINQGSFLVGLRYTTATNSSVLNTLIPIFTLLIVTIRGQEKLTLRRALGFLFAFSGVLAMRKIEEFSLSNKTLIGDLLTMLNCLSFALYLSYSKKFVEKYDRVWMTTWQFAYGSLGLTLLAMPSYLDFQLPEMTPTLMGAMIFAVLGGTLATYFLNNWTLAHTKSSSVALFGYIQPIVTAGFAWVWVGQAITLRTSVACVLIFVGMLLALSPKKKVPAPQPIAVAAVDG